MATPVQFEEYAKDCDPELTAQSEVIQDTVDRLAERYGLSLDKMIVRHDVGYPRLVLDVYVQTEFSNDVSEFLKALPVVVGSRVTTRYPSGSSMLFAMGHPSL